VARRHPRVVVLEPRVHAWGGARHVNASGTLAYIGRSVHMWGRARCSRDPRSRSHRTLNLLPAETVFA